MVLSFMLKDQDDPDEPLQCSENSALVLLCVNKAKSILTARCVRSSCSNKCFRAKAQSGQCLYKEYSCGHVKGTWQFINQNYKCFRVG